MRKSRRTAIALLPVAALALAACSSGSGAAPKSESFSTSPTGTLNAWGFDNADDVGQSRLDFAKKKLSDVDIKLDATAFDAQKFTTRLAGGNVPDVVQMDRRFVTTYAAQDLIMPVDDCFSAYDVDPDKQYYKFVVDDVRYQGKVWAVPQFYQPPAIILNKRVMDKAGVTNDQIDTSKPDVLLAAIQKMYKAKNGVPSLLGFDPVATGQAGLWVLGEGGQLIDKDGKPTLDDPSNVKGLELLKKITDAQGGFAKVKSFTDSFDVFGDKNQYVTDQVGAEVNAQWYPNVLGTWKDKIDIEAVPFRGADGKPFSVASGTAFVIPAGAKNKDAACAWMINLTSQDAWMAAGEARAATRAKDKGINTGLFTGSPEADKAVRDKWVKPSGNAGFDQVIATYYDVLGYGKTFGSSPAGQDIESELNNAVTAALLGDKTPDKALKDAQAAAERAYNNVTGGS
jgi:multiple sugar transport system substrate-binding protein